MIRRCTVPTEKSYARYGGRGIMVCERWRRFENFVEDMGERPKGTTLERKDNDGNYEPDNCKWATRAEQMRNMRVNRHLTANGKTMIVRDWSHERNLPPNTILNRLNRKWTVDEALGFVQRKGHAFLPKGWTKLAKQAGLRHGLVHSRVVYLGWSFEKAISTPPVWEQSQYRKRGSARIPSATRKALGVRAL